jgi:uncharacterized protein YjbI with pentapeptide repeats
MDFGLGVFQFAKDLLPKLWKSLMDIRSKRQKELDDLADIFGNPFALARYYIEPDCQQVNPLDYAEDEAIVREPLFRRMESFISGKEERANRQLFILSDAGMGKTSALLMLKLAHLTSFWPKGYNCELLKLGSNSLEQIAAIEHKRKTILLLDALDEDPTAWKRIPARLHELLQATSSFFRVIITCRTQFFDGNVDPFNRRGMVEVSGFVCPVIYASLFSDQQVEQYIKNRYSEKFADKIWLKRVKNIVSRMGFLRMRPMLLAHLDDLLESNEQTWNEYSIYRALVASWLLREQSKSSSTDPEYAKKLKQACMYAAYQMHMSGRLYFTMNETVVLSKIAGDPAGHRSIDIGGRSLLNKDSNGNFRFSHYSILEYLAIEYHLATSTDLKRFPDLRITAFMNQLGVAWFIQATPEERAARDIRIFNFESVNFKGFQFDTIRFAKLNFTSASFCEARLNGVDFSGANLVQVDFTGAICKNVDFSKATLSEANFTGAVFVNCNFSEAVANQAIFDNSDLTGIQFNKAMLVAAKFNGANLKGVNFTEAEIDGISIDNAVLGNAVTWPAK